MHRSQTGFGFAGTMPAPGLTEVELPRTPRRGEMSRRRGEFIDRLPTLSDAVYQALARLGRNQRGASIELSAGQIPGMPVIGEAREMVYRTLRLLVEMAGTRRGSLKVSAFPGNQRDVLLVARFVAQAAGPDSEPVGEPEDGELFRLAERTGSHLLFECDYPETTAGLRLRLPETVPTGLWAWGPSRPATVNAS
jgi:hypothetical protein